MKALVTGASGFVGRHLLEHLKHRGHEVTAVVRRTGLASHVDREVVVDGIGGDTDWTDVLAGHDVVIHLAARVHVMRDNSMDPLAEHRAVNTAGTLRLAHAAADQGVRRFVFMSTIKVNGEGQKNHRYEASDFPNPRDPYGLSKLEAETALLDLAKRSDLDVAIVRSPLVYGPDVGGNFRRMLALVRSGIPLPLGSVKNRRTMTSVWNLVDLLEQASLDQRASGAVVLAGDAFSPSTPELFRAIAEAAGRPSRLFPFPVGILRLGAGLLRKSDLVDRLIGSLEVEPGSSTSSKFWKPSVSFEDGIMRTVAWYENAMSKEVGD
ncbi:NAD-dependent epimerase/dehydratase family protein [Diaminobutyricimonas sp. LJ205]|uniref:NAD-dependent epimerase/dehydratase family protein n=1 Tax=Diaminobutyricimonas sp. LJ205 TaxID=2683590 RepID=UPI0012F52862|nr:NAD-dependent epimerase/dehydratase family protein [Diaminobutyricimonas sp. LJ205]